jgi:hypothetical protein
LSAKWAVSLFLIILGLGVVVTVIFGDPIDWVGSIAAAWVVAVWGMGGFPKTVGPNTFGPDPLD